MRLCMLHYVYENKEVEFTVSIPWNCNENEEDNTLTDGLHWLLENFGLDPMCCYDSYVEWA